MSQKSKKIDSRDQVSHRIPHRAVYGESMNFLISSLESQAEIRKNILDKEGYTGLHVMGFKLPAWQRPARWTDMQCIRFVESVYRGMNIGAFMANSQLATEFNMILLDGQQRLRAIERYLHGEIAVPGLDGRSYLWTELTDDERAHFRRVTFPCIETKYKTEEEMREAYNLHNFGGTPHLETERA